jgi:hypothetical protein
VAIVLLLVVVFVQDSLGAPVGLRIGLSPTGRERNGS